MLNDSIEEIESNLGFYKIIPHIRNDFNRFKFRYTKPEEIDNMFSELKEAIQNAGWVDFDCLDEEEQDIYDEAVSLIEAKKASLGTDKKEKTKKSKKNHKKAKEEAPWQQLGISTEQFIMGLIRKHEPIKQELKKLKKNKLITNSEMKYYLTLKKEHDNFLDNDYTDFNFEEAEKMEEKLQNIIEKFKANDSWDSTISLMELIAPTTESHIAFSKKLFNEAAKAQNKILKYGELSNPVIYKYYTSVAIIAEQIYINKDYEDNKLIEAAKEMSIEKSLITYDYERSEILKTIRDNMSQTIANVFYYEESSPLQCAKLFHTKLDLINVFDKIKLHFHNIIKISETYKKGENDLLFNRHVLTLFNILETFEKEIMYEFKKINLQERQAEACNYSYKSEKGKAVFFKVHKALTQENIFSIDNLAISLKVSLEEANELVSYYTSEFVA